VLDPRPNRGAWVQVVPLQPFIASPDPRQLVLIASTEALTTSPPAKLRGSVRLRIDDLGVVAILVQPIQNGQLRDYIGGIQLTNALGATGAPRPPGSAEVLTGFALERVNDIFPFTGGGILGTVPAGSAVSISWSIDQTASTFSASIESGATKAVRFAPASSSPFEGLHIYFWMQKPTSASAVFIDDLFVEEY
jgi:hypothetical protein